MDAISQLIQDIAATQRTVRSRTAAPTYARGETRPYDYGARRGADNLDDATRRQIHTHAERQLDALLVRIRVLTRLYRDHGLTLAQARMLRDLRRQSRELSLHVHVKNPAWQSKLKRSRTFARLIDAADVPASLFARPDIDRIIAVAAGLPATD